MIHAIVNFFKQRFFSKPMSIEPMSEDHKKYLMQTVSFYRNLAFEDRTKFESRCQSFIANTQFIGHELNVSEHDKLLIASASVILAWGFKRWEYVRVDTVYLVARSFNENSEFGANDSNITGLVGTHHLRGKMILVQSALHQGFSNDNDKRNVAIHEFAHLIDMADGDIDGLPSQLTSQAFALPWFSLIQEKIQRIDSGHSDIRNYGATNNAEFFSVVTEYFFERPKMLKRRHPILYKALESFYKQNHADTLIGTRLRKKGPCPCGSGKRYKRCCMV